MPVVLMRSKELKISKFLLFMLVPSLILTQITIRSIWRLPRSDLEFRGGPSLAVILLIS